MKPTPIHLIVSNLKRMKLPLQIQTLQALVSLEKPYSVRRNELLSILAGKMTKQLRWEARQERRKAA